MYTIKTRYTDIKWHYNKGRLFFLFFSCCCCSVKWKWNVGLYPIEIDGTPSIILFKHVSHGRFTVCRFKQHQCVTYVQIIRNTEVNIIYHNKHTTFKTLGKIRERAGEETYLHTNLKKFHGKYWRVVGKYCVGKYLFTLPQTC